MLSSHFVLGVRWLLGQSLEDFGRIEIVILLDNGDSGVSQHLGQKDLHDLRRQPLRHSSRSLELNIQKVTLVMDHSLWINLCAKN